MENKKVYQPEGNYYDKYNTNNPMAIRIMKGYFDALDSVLDEIRDEVKSVLEAGCGEGEVPFHVYDYFGGTVKQEAFDISEKVITEAKKRIPISSLKLVTSIKPIRVRIMISFCAAKFWSIWNIPKKLFQNYWSRLGNI